MRLVTFEASGERRIGILKGEAVIDLNHLYPSLPRDMAAFLSLDAFDVARRAEQSETGHFSIGEVTLKAPVPAPPKILAVALNYRDHAAEAGYDIPTIPIIFSKQRTSAHGPYEPVHRPPESEQLDYEGELAFVIGRRCRRVPRERAAEVIAGYTIVNDVSVRDWQLRTPTQMMGKSWDTHCPMGPALVTPDEVGDPHALSLETWVNGSLRQASNTSELIFDCFTLVEHISTAFTLEPGDVITTGTTKGVGLGFNPKIWLKAGDVVRIKVGDLGHIENEVIDEPHPMPVIG
ncbi:MAG: fumarylacetoacetate hydrolase family protein [Rhodocyclaceae bacterium]|nr:fumarylacetoacetate hydrolase family protein [Rhodocyclaceae bacterium]